MGFKNFGVFLLLLFVQLHPLLALRQKSLPTPSIATEGSLMSAKLGDDKPNIITVNRLRGFGGSRGGGGFGGSRGGSSGFGGRSGSGGKSSTSVAKSGAAAGAATGAATGTAVGLAGSAVAMNHLTSRDSNGAYLNYVSLSLLTLALLAYCFLLRF